MKPNITHQRNTTSRFGSYHISGLGGYLISQRETLNEIKLTCELLKGSPRSSNLFSRLVGLVRWVLSNQTDPPTKGTASSYLTELTYTKGLPKANRTTLRELAWALERTAHTVYPEPTSY